MNLKLQREGENRDKIDSPLTKTFCFQSIPKSIKISHSNARRRKIISKRAIVPFIITIKNFLCALKKISAVIFNHFIYWTSISFSAFGFIIRISLE